MRAGSGSCRSSADLAFPRQFVWGEYAAAARPDAASGARLLRVAGAGARFDPRRCGDGVRLGRRPAGRRLAGRAGRGRVQPCADVERGDAPHRRRRSTSRRRRRWRRRSSSRTCRTATRSCWRGSGTRRLLDVPAGSRHPADQHVLRQRPGRRLALQAATRRLHARGHAARRSPRASRARWSASRCSPCSRCSGWLRGCTGADASDARPSATLRSLYPIVLGLGGWFLGVLIVITTMPGVPLDDELLAVLSVGVPVGLGIYLAWVHRDWSARSKSVGPRGGSSQARSSAPGWGSTRRPTCWRSSPRSSGATAGGEPGAHRPRHGAGSPGSRASGGDSGQRDSGSAPFDRLRNTAVVTGNLALGKALVALKALVAHSSRTGATATFGWPLRENRIGGLDRCPVRSASRAVGARATRGSRVGRAGPKSRRAFDLLLGQRGDPALIPYEVAGGPRRHPLIPATAPSKSPARAANPRICPLSPEAP